MARDDLARNRRALLRGGIGDLGLTAHEALVLLKLMDHAGPDGIAWPSQLTIADDLGVARATVQRALTRLLELGAVVEHEPGRSGRATRYRIVPYRPQPASQRGRWVA